MKGIFLLKFVAICICLFNFFLVPKITNAQTLQLYKYLLPGNYSQTYNYGNDRIDIVGKIEENLLVRIQGLLKESDIEVYGSLTAYLNSDGGNFSEALKVAEYFSQVGVTTVVDAEATCLSACAVIFMSGWVPPYEGSGWTSRFMHVSSTIGFHAPFIPYFNVDVLNKSENLTMQDYIDESRDVYARAMVAIGKMLSATTTPNQWPSSLVGEMLLISQNGEQFRYINTIDDAMRWKIELLGLPDPDLGFHATETIYTACMNWTRWNSDEKWFEYADLVRDINFAVAPSQQISILDANYTRSKTYEVSLDAFSYQDCAIHQLPDDNDRWYINDFTHLSPAYKYHPNTLLREIDILNP